MQDQFAILFGLTATPIDDVVGNEGCVQILVSIDWVLDAMCMLAIGKVIAYSRELRKCLVEKVGVDLDAVLLP